MLRDYLLQSYQSPLVNVHTFFFVSGLFCVVREELLFQFVLYYEGGILIFTVLLIGGYGSHVLFSYEMQ